jgi:hypothetical protein
MSATPGQPVVVAPAQLTVLQFGGRQITIPDWPLARQVDERRQQELVISWTVANRSDN